MNIIEKTRQILSDFPKIQDILGEVHIDLSEADPNSCGLMSMGDSLISEDILGNQTRQHIFLLYTTFSGMNDFERLSNSSFLLELTNYLEKCTKTEMANDTIEKLTHSELEKYTHQEIEDEVFDESGNEVITQIKAENGMIYDVPDENLADGIRYQLTITVIYNMEVC